MTELHATAQTYGDIMRIWRKKRRYSQLTFSEYAGISSRHLSFLESGRARPSREMVLKLADCLGMPKLDVNHALLCAGFAPAFKARPQGDADLTPVHEAINILLRNHMPYPALVMDRHWTITGANEAAVKLLIAAGFGGRTNFLEALASQSPEESAIINWADAIGILLDRLRTELNLLGDDDVLRELAQKLQANLEAHCPGHVTDRALAILPTRLAIDDEIISVFSTITQFGTVQDITLDDLKVELMFPMDDVSTRYFQNSQLMS